MPRSRKGTPPPPPPKVVERTSADVRAMVARAERSDGIIRLRMPRGQRDGRCVGRPVVFWWGTARIEKIEGDSIIVAVPVGRVKARTA